jgi:hypothetical protein
LRPRFAAAACCRLYGRCLSGARRRVFSHAVARFRYRLISNGWKAACCSMWNAFCRECRFTPRRRLTSSRLPIHRFLLCRGSAFALCGDLLSGRARRIPAGPFFMPILYFSVAVEEFTRRTVAYAAWVALAGFSLCYWSISLQAHARLARPDTLA